MKTLRLLLAAMLTAWAAVAAATPPGPPASLSVYSEQGQAFSFALDGRPLMQPMARQLRVGLLPPGQHWADVSVFTPYGPPVRFRTSLWLQPGADNSYMLVLRRSGPQLRPVPPNVIGSVYGGQYPPAGVPAPYPGQAPVAPGTYNPAAPGGYPSGSAYPATPAPGAYPSSPAYPGTPVPGASPGGGAGAPGQPGGYPPGGSYPAPGNSGYYPDGPAPYLPPLSPADFDGLQRTMAQRPFDDERLGIAKQALGQSMVRADQLAALVRTLSFDKSRINLAEFGYAHVADPQNFYLVYDALQYRSSIREVQQALGLPQN